MPSEIEYHHRPDMPFGGRVKCICVSLLLHLGVLALILIVPSGASVHNRALRPQAIDVRLVALNPELAAPKSRAPAPVVRSVASKELPTPSEKPTVKPEPKSEPVPVKASLKKEIKKDYVLKTPEPPKPKVKEPPPKPAVEPKKVIADAVRRIEEKAETDRPRSVQERIEQMKEEVGDLAYAKPSPEGGEEQTGAGGDAGAQGYSHLQIYQAEVQVKMKQNWAFSSELAGDTQGLESRLVIKVLPNGQITDVWFEKRSGNSYLDESAYKTVMKSNPLPPLPEDYPKPFYHLVLGFTPSGMK